MEKRVTVSPGLQQEAEQGKRRQRCSACQSGHHDACDDLLYAEPCECQCRDEPPDSVPREAEQEER